MRGKHKPLCLLWVNAAKKAFNASGLTPSDVHVAELLDCFTIAELIEMVDAGFCAKWAGKELIAEGATNIDGEIPINLQSTRAVD